MEAAVCAGSQCHDVHVGLGLDVRSVNQDDLLAGLYVGVQVAPDTGLKLGDIALLLLIFRQLFPEHSLLMS